MKVHHATSDQRAELWVGDARSLLDAIQPGSVQCVVTSPPYWSLRKYGHWEMQMLWGTWDHFPPSHRYPGDLHQFWLRWRAAERVAGRGHPGEKSTLAGTQTAMLSKEAGGQGVFCRYKCCWIGAFGLEPTPQLYIEHSMAFLDVLWEALREDGVLFWNLGDSYSGSNQGVMADGSQVGGAKQQTNKGSVAGLKGIRAKNIRPKSLCLVPERFALAAQERGWIVRSRIAWTKPNPMPESVTDRPTDAWETIWMLTKAPRYYWDQEAVREPQTEGTLERFGKNPRISSPRKWTGMAGESHTAIQEYLEARHGMMSGLLPNGRNLRNVWEFPTEPYPEAHFAVFPRELVRRCVLAATSEKGNCSACGKPWMRMLGKRKRAAGRGSGNKERFIAQEGQRSRLNTHLGSSIPWEPFVKETLDWSPQCSCERNLIPPLVLDPFNGSGTTTEVAYHLGRRVVGVDLSKAYCALAAERLRQGVLMKSKPGEGD